MTDAVLPSWDSPLQAIQWLGRRSRTFTASSSLLMMTVHRDSATRLARTSPTGRRYGGSTTELLNAVSHAGQCVE